MGERRTPGKEPLLAGNAVIRAYNFDVLLLSIISHEYYAHAWNAGAGHRTEMLSR